MAGGDKIPRKRGPGLIRSDLLVINKVDLAPYVGASLEVMARDSDDPPPGPPVPVHQLPDRRGRRRRPGADYGAAAGAGVRPHLPLLPYDERGDCTLMLPLSAREMMSAKPIFAPRSGRGEVSATLPPGAAGKVGELRLELGPRAERTRLLGDRAAGCRSTSGGRSIRSRTGRSLRTCSSRCRPAASCRATSPRWPCSAEDGARVHLTSQSATRAYRCETAPIRQQHQP